MNTHLLDTGRFDHLRQIERNIHNMYDKNKTDLIEIVCSKRKLTSWHRMHTSWMLDAIDPFILYNIVYGSVSFVW